MEETRSAGPMWRVWVSTQRRIVSFHQEEGFRLLEFHIELTIDNGQLTIMVLDWRQ